MAVIGEQGWASAVEETDRNNAGIAAPVRERGGYVVASVGIAGSVDRICDANLRLRADLAQLVVHAGNAISRELGHGREW